MLQTQKNNNSASAKESVPHEQKCGHLGLQPKGDDKGCSCTTVAIPRVSLIQAVQVALNFQIL
jgi:hypothetical protein